MPEKIYLPDIVGKGYASFWNAIDRYRVVKGGRASKKSKTMALWVIMKMMEFPLANTLVVRKVANTHKDSTFAELEWATQRLKVDKLWYFIKNPMEATYRPTGQKILFRGFDEPTKLTSITVSKGYLCWVWVEEAYEIENEDDFNILDETIRGELPEGMFRQITLTFNPWVNSHWTKKRFFDKTDPNAFTLTTTYKCNEWLDKAYKDSIEALKETNPERYKVVALGEYGIAGGAFFDEFRRDVHIAKPFPIPEDWRRYRTIDYGYDMLACYWVAMDTKGKMYVYDELYESGLIVSEAAEKIRNKTAGLIRETFAPPDMLNRQKDTGKSMKDLFGDNGVWLTIASNAREAGWASVREWIKVYEAVDEFTGETILDADLKIFPNCVNLIRCMESIAKDERNPNDCATEPHEVTHANDSIRYLLAGRPAPSVKSAEPKKFKFIEEFKRYRELQKQYIRRVKPY